MVPGTGLSPEVHTVWGIMVTASVGTRRRQNGVLSGIDLADLSKNAPSEKS